MTILKTESVCPAWIGYTLIEGGKLIMVGCRDEEVADYVVEEFEKVGKLNLGGKIIAPHSLYKFKAEEYLVKLPEEEKE